MRVLWSNFIIFEQTVTEMKNDEGGEQIDRAPNQ